MGVPHLAVRLQVSFGSFRPGLVNMQLIITAHCRISIVAFTMARPIRCYQEEPHLLAFDRSRDNRQLMSDARVSRLNMSWQRMHNLICTEASHCHCSKTLKATNCLQLFPVWELSTYGWDCLKQSSDAYAICMLIVRWPRDGSSHHTQ